MKNDNFVLKLTKRTMLPVFSSDEESITLKIIGRITIHPTRVGVIGIRELKFCERESCQTKSKFPRSDIGRLFDTCAVNGILAREFKIRRLRTANYGWTSVVLCL